MPAASAPPAAPAAAPLQVGSMAPDFTLPDQYGGPWSLGEHHGKAVLLLFFPFAFSGVCTGELVGIRDRLGEFETERSTIATVSCDSMFAMRAMADRDALFFPILSDFWPHGQVARSYGVLDETSGGVNRSSYLIDPDGQVHWSVHHETGLARDLDEHVEAVRRLLG